MYPAGASSEQLLYHLRTSGTRATAADILQSLKMLSEAAHARSARDHAKNVYATVQQIIAGGREEVGQISPPIISRHSGLNDVDFELNLLTGGQSEKADSINLAALYIFSCAP